MLFLQAADVASDQEQLWQFQVHRMCATRNLPYLRILHGHVHRWPVVQGQYVRKGKGMICRWCWVMHADPSENAAWEDRFTRRARDYPRAFPLSASGRLFRSAEPDQLLALRYLMNASHFGPVHLFHGSLCPRAPFGTPLCYGRLVLRSVGCWQCTQRGRWLSVLSVSSQALLFWVAPIHSPALLWLPFSSFPRGPHPTAFLPPPSWLFQPAPGPFLLP